VAQGGNAGMTKQPYHSGATISDCGKYRYHLWRIWDDELPILAFVMLNPSTADAKQDDPTIRKCIGFAKRDGYGGISIRNVFAWRATDPSELTKVDDPFGPKNPITIQELETIQTPSKIIVAWGNRIYTQHRNHKLHIAYRWAAGVALMGHAYCLGINQNGDPKHPLYLPNTTPWVLWKSPGYF
jgi:hypothetical protein